MKHLTEHQIAGFLDRALPPDERRLVEEHLEACPGCRREVVAMHRMLADLPNGAGRPTWRRRWWIPAAVAAGLALFLFVPGRFHAGGSPSAIRAPAVDGERKASISVITPADDETAKTPLVFMWHPVTADVYRLSVLADDGRPVWNRQTPETSLALPTGVPLTPGRAYFWRVDAIANGLVASSGIHRLTIGP